MSAEKTTTIDASDSEASQSSNGDGLNGLTEN